MAQSKRTVDRLARLEDDVGGIRQTLTGHGERFDRLDEILLEHAQRFDRIDKTLLEHAQRLDRIDERLDHIDGAIYRLHRGFTDRFEALEHRFDSLEQSLNSRLDRLLAVTLEERTRNYERLADIERRLTKVEERGR